MDDVDQWLSAAAARTSQGLSASGLARIDQQLADEPLPSVFAGRRDARRSMLCAGIAAVISVAATNALIAPPVEARPTWVAAPPASSPYSLLIGE